ncbi:hypothetical protein FB451DRAFT_1172845 [Mycena latifolia]|nr:hypothetical protein FB451DRAFT_1172845 [Mycena latifolia]
MPPSENEPAPVDSAQLPLGPQGAALTLRLPRNNLRGHPLAQIGVTHVPPPRFRMQFNLSQDVVLHHWLHWTHVKRCRQEAELGRTVTPAAPPLQALQPHTPPRAAPHTRPPFLPQTPGRVAAIHLRSCLNTQTLMASPGPPLRNQSDDESEQDDEESENLGITLDSDEEASPLPRRSHFNRRRGIPPVQPFPQVNDAVVQQQQGRSQAGGANDKWNGYRVDQDSFAWATDTVLEANSKSADCQAFYEEHIQGFKCKLCPQLYAAASSLTTRRNHLGKAHLPEYLALIQARGLPKKLPNALKQQREKQRARDSARTTFSVKTLEDQLLTVIVANDLTAIFHTETRSAPGSWMRGSDIMIN